jgi:FemAB-related protein (PEP-CTERM system-associated)
VPTVIEQVNAEIATPAAPVRVVDVTAADAQRWDDFVNASPSSTLYHLYGWRRVVEQTFGHRTYYWCAVSGPHVTGVLPLVRLKSWMFGDMVIALPYFNYGGICADDAASRDALLRAGIALTRDVHADFLEVRETEDWGEGLPRKTSKVSMRLPLTRTKDELWKGLGAKLRNQVQRPGKEGMTAAIGREERLDDFYDVFAANMRDLGTPVYPKAFFRNILRQFPDRTWIATVTAGRRTVAAGFLAGFKDRLEIPWASSLRAFNRFSPNMLLYWRSLEFACERGYRVFDFGRSSPGESTYRFKEQWGARPHQLYWYYWLPDGGEMPQVNPKNPKYRAAIKVWQNLPLSLTRYLGPGIVKYLP